MVGTQLPRQPARPRTVLLNAGPWLPVPPPGYGGIENVLATLIPELRARGVRVVLATVAESTAEVDRTVAVFRHGQFGELGGPYNHVVGIAHAHMQGVIAELRRARDVDLVHDHLEVVGPSMLATLERPPPVLQTLHWDLSKHARFYADFDGGGRVFFNALSRRQLLQAPATLRRQVLATIPLATPAVAAGTVPRGDYVALLGRICREKGADIAARACRQAGRKLRMAGPVAGVHTRAQLARRIADPLWRARPDAAYYLEEVRPLEDARVGWVGTLDGEAKRRFLARARALICPLRWEEPGATAAIEALACGTPVVAMRRGALAEIVEHGVTGFLADDEQELAHGLARVGEIDPRECRRAARERFAPALMAERYVALYEEVLARAALADSPLADSAEAEHDLERVALAPRQLRE
jgi:glycosyltransferase involved in cell wall biosynthesis